eukprot:5064577-Prymnesium_polylepis.1
MCIRDRSIFTALLFRHFGWSKGSEGAAWDRLVWPGRISDSCINASDAPQNVGGRCIPPPWPELGMWATWSELAVYRHWPKVQAYAHASHVP